MDRTIEYIRYNNLFDLYGNLLNEHEKEIYKLFYEEDLSLQEIADLRKVSKSAIGKTIQTITKKLESYEEKLGFLNKFHHLEKVVEESKDSTLKEKIKKILEED